MENQGPVRELMAYTRNCRSHLCGSFVGCFPFYQVQLYSCRPAKVDTCDAKLHTPWTMEVYSADHANRLPSVQLELEIREDC